MKQMCKKLVILMVAFAMIFASSASVFAVSGKPYKDVSKKSVGTDAYKAIKYLKSKGGYHDAGLVKKGKFHPHKKITRKQCIKVLINLYGKDNVPIKDGDRTKKTATARWLCHKMVQIAEEGFGMKIEWEESSKKLSRALASQYIKSFIDFDSAFVPK